MLFWLRYYLHLITVSNFEHLSSSPVFSGVRVAWSLVFCAMFCRPLFCSFVLIILAIIISVLRLMASSRASKFTLVCCGISVAQSLVFCIVLSWSLFGFFSFGVVWFMVLNATFNNISAISWWSVLLVEETGVSADNHRPVASHWQIVIYNCVLSTPRLSGVRTHNVSGDRHRLHR